MTLYDDKIQELIERKQDLLVDYRDSLFADDKPNAEPNWAALETAITNLYHANDLPNPRIIHVESPWQAAVALVVMQLIKCGDEKWRAQLRVIFLGTLWQNAFDSLVGHVSKNDHGIASDGSSSVWIPGSAGRNSHNNQSYILRCDKALRDSISGGQFAVLRSILHIPQNHVPPGANTVDMWRNWRMVRPNRQQMLHLYSLSENSRRQIVDRPNNITELRTTVERAEVASFDRSLRENTLEAELIDLFPDELIQILPKKLFLSAQNSQLTHHESVEILAAHFAKVFCDCIMGIQWQFPKEEWLALNSFPLDFLDQNFYEEPLNKILKAWPVLLKNNVPHLFLNNLCFLIGKPVHIKMDEDGRLHCETDSAVEYTDGFKLYSWHSVTVPADVVLSPSTITIASIEAESNTEVRRVMIERFGEARYIDESGAQLQHEDRYGQLYRKVLPDEDFVMVKVKNSSPEPDGTYRFYYIRVPPTMNSAHEAVAWTFNLSVDEYNPDIET